LRAKRHNERFDLHSGAEAVTVAITGSSSDVREPEIGPSRDLSGGKAFARNFGPPRPEHKSDITLTAPVSNDSDAADQEGVVAVFGAAGEFVRTRDVPVVAMRNKGR